MWYSLKPWGRDGNFDKLRTSQKIESPAPSRMFGSNLVNLFGNIEFNINILTFENSLTFKFLHPKTYSENPERKISDTRCICTTKRNPDWANAQISWGNPDPKLILLPIWRNIKFTEYELSPSNYEDLIPRLATRLKILRLAWNVFTFSEQIVKPDLVLWIVVKGEKITYN